MTPAEQSQFFKTCFPNIERGTSTVKDILSSPRNKVLTRSSDGRVVGLSILRDNVVLMLGVLPSCRGKGIGTALLEQTEEEIRAAGYREIRFTGGPVYLAPGIPIGQGYEHNDAFFVNHGYVHEWGAEECVDMDLDLTKPAAYTFNTGDSKNGILYRFAELSDMDSVIACAEDGHPEFAKYYECSDAYRADFGRWVLMAEKDGITAGALMVFDEKGTEAAGLGSVGCTVVRHAERNRGIATAMVQAGTSYLRSLGLKRAFLGYTYTGIVPMYARSGYQICMKYMMAVKKL